MKLDFPESDEPVKNIREVPEQPLQELGSRSPRFRRLHKRLARNSALAIHPSDGDASQPKRESHPLTAAGDCCYFGLRAVQRVGEPMKNYPEGRDGQPEVRHQCYS